MKNMKICKDYDFIQILLYCPNFPPFLVCKSHKPVNCCYIIFCKSYYSYIVVI